MKLIFNLLAVVFLVITALQFNDPDPIYWVAVYFGTAMVLAGSGIGSYSTFWTAVIIGTVLAGLLWTGPGFWNYLQAGDYSSIFGDMRGPAYIEETREFLSLILALAVLLFARKFKR